MLVLMTCTLLLGAPFTAVGGVILAMRQDIGLSWIFVVTIPLVLVAQGSIIVRMTPTFRLMQEKIDRINAVLRRTGSATCEAAVKETLGRDITQPEFWAEAVHAMDHPLKQLEALVPELVKAGA